METTATTTILILTYFISTISTFNAQEINKQIVSGVQTGDCEFPHMVFLVNDLSTGGVSACGGALLDSYHVLTAAHCLKNIVGVTAYFGHANKYKATQIIKGSKWKLHERYQSRTSVFNDVGMIRLEKPVKLGRCVQTIDLPKKDQTFSGTCVAAGWGKISNSQDGPDHLRKATVKLMPIKECQKHYDGILKQMHICIGDRTKMGQNVCAGDSGSPLMCKSGGKLVVAGIASFVYDCDQGFGVYANVAGLLDWVKETQKNL